jgi:hypothetical protein
MASYSFYGAEYGIRPGLFAVVRSCSPRAHFLVLLFVACCQFLLFIVGVAVWVAVLNNGTDGRPIISKTELC